MQEQLYQTALISPPTPRSHFRGWALLRQALLPLLTPLVLLMIWQIITMLQVFPVFLVPPPAAVFQKLQTVVNDGRLWLHVGATLQEVIPGLFVGASAGLIIGYGIAKIPLLEKVLSPIVVALQATPILAYAPLLVVWFGTGVTSKIVTSALVVFFPMLMNTVVGIRNVPPSLHDLMRALRANRWQTFTRLEIPAALPVLMTGLKTSATLAVIGAVVGEFVVANAGLGHWVQVARDSYDTPLVYVAILLLTLLALSLYGAVSLLERRVLAWQRRALSK